MSGRRDLVSTTIVPRIKAVLTAAEQTAAIVAEEAESEAGRRTAEILAAAEADANRIRREATRRVEDYLAATRRRIDAFAAARIERITELTEGVLEAAESIQERLEQATQVQQQVHAMIAALGNVAEAVAQEVAEPSPTLPQPPTAPAGQGNGRVAPPTLPRSRREATLDEEDGEGEASRHDVRAVGAGEELEEDPPGGVAA